MADDVPEERDAPSPAAGAWARAVVGVGPSEGSRSGPVAVAAEGAGAPRLSAAGVGRRAVGSARRCAGTACRDLVRVVGGVGEGWAGVTATPVGRDTRSGRAARWTGMRVSP
ncbi:hypothetical protein AQJ30_04235 [Streptomyces longwoodensis]|uniref:Uncharacterized protein n=1 Tax=Streptomyces longwoodensis TaxID=68231 RepID=A0A124HSB0_9ACTN|nr:hypothetical protein AQJ30_04235 [Streptomyces longwoodensis]